jgi:alpha-beta hydrolase superfamily lysophospholipase/DNA-binding CsgD family transcriptional regulator
LLDGAIEALAAHVAAVWAGDLRGHGGSVSARAPLAHLDPETGWEALLADMAALARAAFDGVPRDRRLLVGGSLSGHLMLDLLARDPGLAGHLVMAAPTPSQPVIHRLGAAFLRMRALARPVDRPDPQLLHHIYGFLRAQLPPGGDDVDTITADPEVVRAIRADPRGFPTPTPGYWMAVFPGLQATWARIGRGALPADLRVLILTGPDEPQTRGGRLVPAMLDWLRERGVAEAAMRSIDGVRANVLIDAPRLPVVPAILDWFAGTAARAPAAPPPGERVDPAQAYLPVLQRLGLGLEGSGLATIPVLIDLCYAALEDDSRWIELIYRLALGAEAEGGEAERLLEAVFPHWQRAFELREELRRAAMLGRLYDDLIDRLDLGVAVLDDEGRLRHANAAFARALARIAPGARAEGWLARALPGGGAGDVPVLHEGQAVGVSFVPASLAGSAPAGTPAGRLVVLRQTAGGTADLSHRAGLLSLAYGLTGQEGAAALHLAEGLTTEACARRMGITENTLRSHLKQVFDKMGVTSRTELAHRILAGPLGWLVSAPPAQGGRSLAGGAA